MGDSIIAAINGGGTAAKEAGREGTGEKAPFLGWDGVAKATDSWWEGIGNAMLFTEGEEFSRQEGVEVGGSGGGEVAMTAAAATTAEVLGLVGTRGCEAEVASLGEVIWALPGAEGEAKSPVGAREWSDGTDNRGVLLLTSTIDGGVAGDGTAEG